MFKPIRQTMAWLHSWLGLLLGWVMFTIFVTGAMSYYKDEINLWSEPQLAKIEYQQSDAIRHAYQYLQENATNADEWYINLPTEKKPVTALYWNGKEGFNQALLNPQTHDELLLDNDVPLGEFFYRFHYQLHGMNIIYTRIFMSFVAFVMLLAIIAGIITHKKIFSDFFTLRVFKGQRSWLDFHNISSVIALPFFLTVCFTGLAIFFYLYIPQGMKQLYGDNNLPYFTEIKEQVSDISNNKNAPAATMQDIDIFMKTLHAQWGDAELKNIVVKNPQRSNATILFEQTQDRSISQDNPRLEFNAITGELLDDRKNRSVLATMRASIYGLHRAPFAETATRLALFFSGLLGSVMIASGLLLWSLKRQLQNKTGEESAGHYLVDRLNIATIIGLPFAILLSFFAIRLQSIMKDNELSDFFSFPFINTFLWAWLLSFTFSMLTPKTRLWRSLLIPLALLCFILPLFDLIYLWSFDHIQNVQQYWLFLRVDIFILALGLFTLFLITRIQPIAQKARKKIERKLQSPNSSETQG